MDYNLSEVQHIEDGVFQNAPFANAPFANGRFPNGDYSCLWAYYVLCTVAEDDFVSLLKETYS